MLERDVNMINKMICPKCNGKGEVRDSIVTNPLVILLTLGLSLALTDYCTTCNGSGIVSLDNSKN